MTDLDRLLSLMVDRILNYLRGQGAEKHADNEPVDPVPWEELEKKFEFPPDLHAVIFDRMIEKGHWPVTNSRGLYLGVEGETARTFNRNHQYIKTMARNMTRRVMLLGRKNKLPQLRDYASSIGFSIPGFLKHMKALGAPVPEEAENILLLEAGD